MDEGLMPRVVVPPYSQPLTVRCEHPSLALSSFVKCFKDFIHYEVYSGFRSIIFAGHNKILQYFFQKQTSGNTLPDYNYPIMTIDLVPEGPDDRVDGFWRNSSMAAGMLRGVTDPFYKDDDLSLYFMTRRYKCSINLTAWASSYPMAFDIQNAFHDGFWGLNRFRQIYMGFYITVPDKFVLTTHEGQAITRQLDEQKLTRGFIPMLNQHKYYIEVGASPRIRLTGMSMNNTLYGGTGLPEFGLTGTVEAEIEVPQYLLCWTRMFKYIELGHISANYQYQQIYKVLPNYRGGSLYDIIAERFKSRTDVVTVGRQGYQVDVDRLTTLDLRSVFTPLPEFTDITVVCPCGIMTSADETPGFTVENNTLMFNDSVVIERGDIVEVLLLKGRSTNL